MRGSFSWWLTRPLRIAAGVWRRDPEYLTRLGQLNPSRLMPWRHTEASPTPEESARRLLRDSRSDPSVEGLFASSLPDLVPLVTYPEPGLASAGRLTVLTDSLDAGSHFGGEATAILFAVALARHQGLRLRWVTRRAPPEPASFGAVLAAHGLDYSDNIDFDYAPTDTGARELGVTDRELLLTTSWQTTWTALKSFDPSRIIYLVQDDERVFHPAGELQLRCREILCDTRPRFVVNTAALRNYLVAGGMTGVAANGVAFEPAFARTIYYRESKAPDRKLRLVFYVRPNHPRNLLLRGLEAMAGAIQSGFFPETEWDCYVVGKAITRIELPRGIVPKIADSLSWRDDTALIRQTDVGLSLSCTPHPGYTPLELAASGAVVVTNQHETRHCLDAYCANILCVAPSVDALVAALGRASQLAKNESTRLSNYLAARIDGDWEATFAPVLDVLAGY